MLKLIIISIAFTSFINCESVRKKEKAVIDNLLNQKDYDHKIPPETFVYHPNELTDKSKVIYIQNGEKPDQIIDDSIIKSNTRAVIDTVDIYLRQIHEISAAKQTIEVQLTLRQRWRDKNLVYGAPEIKYINLNPSHHIWKPDLFVSNEISGYAHGLLEPNSLVRLYQNGSVLYSIRVTLKLSCPMDFKHFPFDSQTCSVILASYGYTTDDLILRWKEANPFQVSKLIVSGIVNHMKLVRSITGKCTARTITGEYSCLKLDLVFERNSKFYICRWFVSSSLCVLIVWLSFLLSKKHSKARIGLLIASTLMLSCVSKDIKNNKPELDYCTTIDIWSMICWLFVIAGYIQYALVQYFSDKEQNGSKCNHNLADDKDKEKLISGNKLQLIREKWLQKSRTSKLDFTSITGLPIVFVLIQLIMLLSHRYVD